MRVIAIANQKGGVGKTTTAINLSYCLALANQKVLLIDIDPQGNATSGLGVSSDQQLGVYQVLLEGFIKPESIKKATIHPNLSVMPGSPLVVGMEQRLGTGIQGRQRLKTSLAAINNKYDFILIDCPPSFGNLSINALCAAESVIIPIQCEYFSMEGLSQMIKIINNIRAELNPSLFVEGILLTMFDKKLEYNQEVLEEVRKHFGGKVYKVAIPRDVAISEASGFAKPVLEYDIFSVGTSGYVHLTREILGYRV